MTKTIKGHDTTPRRDPIPELIRLTLDKLLDQITFEEGDGIRIITGSPESKYLTILSHLRSKGYSDVMTYYRRYTAKLNEYFTRQEELEGRE